MIGLRQEFIPGRRRRPYGRYVTARPAVDWTRWERFAFAFALGGVSLMAAIVLLLLLAGELAVVWAFLTT